MQMKINFLYVQAIACIYLEVNFSSESKSSAKKQNKD